MLGNPRVTAQLAASQGGNTLHEVNVLVSEANVVHN
jgi:hypothetical protein